MGVQGNDEVFVPNGDSRRETAILLLGTAEEYDLDPRHVRAVNGGFFISNDLADVVYDGDVEPYESEDEDAEAFLPADHDIAGVKDFVSENPDALAEVLASEQAGKNRTTLVEWLLNQTSSNRAAENQAQDKE